MTKEPEIVDLHERTRAVCASIDALKEDFGYDLLDVLAGSGDLDDPPIPALSAKDRDVAASLTAAYASDPEKTSKAVNTIRAAKMSAPSLIAIRAYLDEFGRSVVHNAAEIRHMVTNRLIEESSNPDPRIRIRALELLGKISDVGLFTERSEVLVTHQSTDELKSKLREKLHRLREKTLGEVQDVEVVDVRAELGLKNTEIPRPN